MEMGLLRRYLKETREWLYSAKLPKGLLSKPNSTANLTFEDREQILDLGLSSIEDLEAYNDLREVLLPGQLRTDLIECLLETFEPGILSANSNADILTCLKQLGIFSDFSKTNIDQIHGFYESLQLMWRLCILLKNEPSRFGEMHEATISYISQNQEALFQSQVRLFPITFPPVQESKDLWKQMEESQNKDFFDSTLSSLMNLQQSTTQAITNLKADNLQGQQAKLANASDLKLFKQSLKELREQIILFNSVLNSGFVDALRSIPQINTSKTDLGKTLNQLLIELEQMKKEEQMTELINGLTEELRRSVKSVQIDQMLSQDLLLSLTQQVKSLKLSVACQQRFPSLY